MESEGKARKLTGTRYSDEVCERAARMGLEHQHEYQTQGRRHARSPRRWGWSRETLRNWTIQAERHPGQRAGATTSEWHVKELSARIVNCAGQPDPAQALCLFRAGGARPLIEAMIAFIQDNRDVYGIEALEPAADRAVDVLPARRAAQQSGAMVSTSASRS